MTASESLHLRPPASPRSVLLRHRLMIWIVAGLSLVFAVAAAVDGGSVLLTWDEPIQRWVEGHRTAMLETVFRSFSRMGSNIVVFPTLALVLAVVARRCRVLAVALAVAVLARPVFEFFIKDLVARERPDFNRLVDGTGFSHPSGHVLAAVTLWGLLPPVIALLTDRRWLWWLSAAVSAVLIAGISASRVYLGVHWFSDIVQGLLLGWLFLTLVETRYVHHHRELGCTSRAIPSASGEEMSAVAGFPSPGAQEDQPHEPADRRAP